MRGGRGGAAAGRGGPMGQDRSGGARYPNCAPQAAGAPAARPRSPAACRPPRPAPPPAPRGVVHRDLKLSNLLLVRPGDTSAVKIADFGLARTAAAAGDALAAAGTPHFMAPEVVDCALKVSPACRAAAGPGDAERRGMHRGPKRAALRASPNRHCRRARAAGI